MYSSSFKAHLPSTLLIKPSNLYVRTHIDHWCAIFALSCCFARQQMCGSSFFWSNFKLELYTCFLISILFNWFYFTNGLIHTISNPNPELHDLILGCFWLLKCSMVWHLRTWMTYLNCFYTSTHYFLFHTSTAICFICQKKISSWTNTLGHSFTGSASNEAKIMRFLF